MTESFTLTVQRTGAGALSISFQPFWCRRDLKTNLDLLDGVLKPRKLSPGVNTTASVEAGKIEDMEKWRPQKNVLLLRDPPDVPPFSPS